MKRRLLKLSLCLALGVVLNVGVAWWCSARATWKGEWTSTDAAAGTSAPVRWLWPERAVPESTWGTPTARWMAGGFGAVGIEVSRDFPVEQGDGVVMMMSYRQSTRRSGWPMSSLETRDQFPARAPWKPRYFGKYTWVNTIEQGVNMAEVKTQELIILPLLPRWPGFAVDTFLYAGIVCVLGRIPTWARRRVRRRRGRCERCGYELKGLGVCPECGREARGSAEESASRRAASRGFSRTRE